MSDKKFCAWCNKYDVKCSDPFACINDNEACKSNSQAIYNAEDEITRLQAENSELKQQLIDVDYTPSISDLRLENERLKAKLNEAKEKLRQAEWSLSNRQNYIDVANEKLRWRKPIEDRPEHGVPVLIKRSNGIVDRAEISELYFDGHPAWFAPWGPTPYDDPNIFGWLPIPDTAPQEGEG